MPEVRFVASSATPCALTTREIEESATVDEELRKVRQAVYTGRFEESKAYAPIAGELFTIGQLVLRGTRIVIPQKMRAMVLALAHKTLRGSRNKEHSAHKGMEARYRQGC